MEWRTFSHVDGLRERVYSGFDPSRLVYFGISRRRFIKSIKRIPKYYRDLKKYDRLSDESSISVDRYYPVLVNFHVDQTAGTASGHFFHQDLWAAKKIRMRDPKRHIDIWSRLDGFISHLLAFREVTIVDNYPFEADIEGLGSVQGEVAELAFFKDESLNSISSLHAAEHIGLGRYGDPIDPEGHTKFMANLQRVLKPDGRLYFSVPVGQERVEFNSHRVLSPHTILNEFDELELVSLDGVIQGEFVESISTGALKNGDNACGLFEFTK